MNEHDPYACYKYIQNEGTCSSCNWKHMFYTTFNCSYILSFYPRKNKCANSLDTWFLLENRIVWNSLKAPGNDSCSSLKLFYPFGCFIFLLKLVKVVNPHCSTRKCLWSYTFYFRNKGHIYNNLVRQFLRGPAMKCLFHIILFRILC